MSRPRAVIAEDHVLIQETIRHIVEGECEVVAAVEDGRAALEAVAAYGPDILLIDVSLPLVNGFSVAEQTAKAHPNVKILMVTAHAEPAYVRRSFEIGASGYLLKGSIKMELVPSIREVLAGGRYCSSMLRHVFELPEPSPLSAAN